MASTTKKDRQHIGHTGDDAGERHEPSLMTAAQQEKIITDVLQKQLPDTGARLDALEEQLETMPQTIVASLRRAVDDKDAPVLVKEAVKEAVKEEVEGNAFMHALRWTGTALKPRKPRQEDVFPVLASNAVTWGGAFALSQVSSGVSDALCDLFSQAAENGIDAV